MLEREREVEKEREPNLFTSFEAVGAVVSAPLLLIVDKKGRWVRRLVSVKSLVL